MELLARDLPAAPGSAAATADREDRARSTPRHRRPAAAAIPKLYIDVAPGFFAAGNKAEVTKHWPNVAVAGPVSGRHFAQEDSGGEIGGLVAEHIGAVIRGREEK